jgi:hypothetical protein
VSPLDIARRVLDALRSGFDAGRGAYLRAHLVTAPAAVKPVLIVEYDPDDALTRFYRVTVEEIDL